MLKALLERFHRNTVVLLMFACVGTLVTQVMMSQWSSWNKLHAIDPKASQLNPEYTIDPMLQTINKSNATTTEPPYTNGSAMDMANLTKPKTDSFVKPKVAENSFAPQSVNNSLTPNKAPMNSTKTGFQNMTYALSLTKMKIPTFLESYRNPCWLAGPKQGIVRCIPYFYIAGFPKCGSTDLYTRVIGHPLVMPGIMKEPHYLTNDFYTFKKLKHRTCDVHCGTEYYSERYFSAAAAIMRIANMTETVNRLRNNEASNCVYKNFPKESRGILEKGQKQYKYPMITVDSSMCTAWHISHWQDIEENKGLTQPAFITADWIKKINPNARIILILRNPVTRSFSEFTYFYPQWAPSGDEFHKRTNESIIEMNKCFNSGTPALLCTINTPPPRLGVSLYHLHLKNWLDRFPRDQILVLRFEDYARNSSRIIEQVYKFLDLPALSPKIMSYITGSIGVVNKTRKPPGLLVKPETNEMLANFFKPHNEKLAELLGDKRFLWND